VALVDAASWLLILGGSFFAVSGGLGIVRFPDFFSRMHAGGLTDTMGAGLLLGGLMFQAGWSLVTVKLVMIFAFLLVTSPTAAHALARSALSHGLQPLVDEEDSPSNP
jgi:multicomponent Na+:H+ antiporter subunit G